MSVVDGEFSANAAALIDGTEGTTDEVSWQHAGNQWDEDQFPMTATVDLGRAVTLEKIEYKVGNIAKPDVALLTVEARLNPGDAWQPAGAGPAGEWNSWSETSLRGEARYLKLSFEEKDQFFNISEINVRGEDRPNGDESNADTPGLTVIESEAVIAPNVSVVTSASSLLSGSTLTTVADLSVGDVVVSGPTDSNPQGYLVKVVSSDGTYVTEPASLEEAFETLNLSFTKELSSSSRAVPGPDLGPVGPEPEELPSEVAAQQLEVEVFAIDRTFDDEIICDSDGNEETTDDQIRVNGQFRAGAEIFGDIEIERRRLETFELGLELDEFVTLEVDGECGDSFDQEYPLFSKEYDTFTIWVGAFPIVITPEVVITMGADGEVNAQVDMNVEQRFNGRYGVEFQRGEGWSAINETTPFLNVSASEFEVAARAQVSVEAKLTATFYRTASVSVAPRPYAEVEAEISGFPPEIEFCARAGLDLDVGVGIKFKIFLFINVDEEWDTTLEDIINPWEECVTSIVEDPIGNPPAPPTTFTLNVAVGSEQFLISGVGISCQASNVGDCTEDFDEGTWVRLTSNVDVTWSGCDTSSPRVCEVRMTADRTVLALP